MRSSRALLFAGLLLLCGCLVAVLAVALHRKSEQVSDLRRERSELVELNSSLNAATSKSHRSLRLAQARLATARAKLRRAATGRLIPIAGGNLLIARPGDMFRVPAAAAECTASGEAGVPNLYCTHYPGVRYQVYFYTDRLQIWQNGNPDAPVFSELP
jgi:hypothetical protein